MADGDFPMLLGMIARCGSTIDVRVSARSNIFGAGIAERPDPAGGGGGVSPACVPVPRSVTTMILETVRGRRLVLEPPRVLGRRPGQLLPPVFVRHRREGPGRDPRRRGHDGRVRRGSRARRRDRSRRARLRHHVARPDRLPRRRLPARRAGYVPATVRPRPRRGLRVRAIRAAPAAGLLHRGRSDLRGADPALPRARRRDPSLPRVRGRVRVGRPSRLLRRQLGGASARLMFG